MDREFETSDACASNGPAWQAAIDYGIDVSQTEYLLSLSALERVQRHDQALEFVRALRQAAIDRYGYDPRLPEPPPPPER